MEENKSGSLEKMCRITGMEVDGSGLCYSSSVLISLEMVKKSKVLFSWNINFGRYFVFLVNISLLLSLWATFSLYYKTIKQVASTCHDISAVTGVKKSKLAFW